MLPPPPPFPRYGAASPAIASPEGELFVFGGLVGNQTRNDLYKISVTAPSIPPSNQASTLLSVSAALLQTGAAIPTPRVSHGCAMVGSVLIMWGGEPSGAARTRVMDGAGENLDNGLYMLNLGALYSLRARFRTSID